MTSSILEPVKSADPSLAPTALSFVRSMCARVALEASTPSARPRGPRARGGGSAVGGGNAKFRALGSLAAGAVRCSAVKETRLADGRLEVRATSVGAHTQLAQMAALAEQAQARKARVQTLVDKVTSYFVPAVIVLAVLVAAGWMIAGTSFEQAFGIDEDVGDVLDVAYFAVAAPDFEQWIVGRALRVGRIEQDSAGEPRPPSGRELPVLALDVMHNR